MSDRDEADINERIAAHLRECEECDGSALDSGVLARVLARSRVEIDAGALSAVTLARAGTELSLRAQTVLRRQVAVLLLLALVPLPGMLIFGVYALRLAYEAVATVLPAGVAGYLAVSYGLSALVVLTASYASIPLLLERLRVRPVARAGCF